MRRVRHANAAPRRGLHRDPRRARAALLIAAAALCGCAIFSAFDGALVRASLLGAAAFALGALHAAHVLLSRRLVVVTVHGISMRPTYQDKDRVLVRRRPPEVGEVVVIEQPAEASSGWPDGHSPPAVCLEADRLTERRWLIKRVAAVAGGEVPRAQAAALEDMEGRRVPAGRLVLLGDNPEASVDSRSLGFFRESGVLGVVVRRLSRG
ncbi:S26 family signal peptidase [Streptomyces sp. NPDC088246]|uniref:S26 family signal peptidase n=1 Tax=Streptomyces sp. NPDC088246 TaxID=3365842 RepID=UPI0037F82667